MPVGSNVKAEQQDLSAGAAQATLMNGAWLPGDDMQQGQVQLQHVPLHHHHQGLQQQQSFHHTASMLGQPDAAAASLHLVPMQGHPGDLLGSHPGLPHMQDMPGQQPGMPPGAGLAMPDMLAVDVAGGGLLGQDVLMPQAMSLAEAAAAAAAAAPNGPPMMCATAQLLQDQQQQQLQQGAWPAQSQSQSSSVGGETSNAQQQEVDQQQRQQSTQRSGGNAGNRKGWVEDGGMWPPGLVMFCCRLDWLCLLLEVERQRHNGYRSSSCFGG